VRAGVGGRRGGVGRRVGTLRPGARPRSIDHSQPVAGEIMAVCMLVMGLVTQLALQYIPDGQVQDIPLTSASRSLIPLCHVPPAGGSSQSELSAGGGGRGGGGRRRAGALRPARRSEVSAVKAGAGGRRGGVGARPRSIDHSQQVAGEIMAVCMLVMGLVTQLVLQYVPDGQVQDIPLTSASRSHIILCHVPPADGSSRHSAKNKAGQACRNYDHIILALVYSA
jgi:hypothetical protein